MNFRVHSYLGMLIAIKIAILKNLKKPMKKITLVILLMTSAISIAQEKNSFTEEVQKKHEVKINALSLIAFKWLDVSYEYLINKESSFGVATLISFNDEIGFDSYRTFSLTPYYRRYFSNGFAKGFFVEGFGMLNSYKNNYSNSYYGLGSGKDQSGKYTDFAVGISAGGKFVTKNGFVAEIYLGLGRNLFNNSNSHDIIDVVGRGGISLGYRF